MHGGTARGPGGAACYHTARSHVRFFQPCLVG
uniref:HSV-2 genomic HindIII l region of short unique component U(s) with genes US2 to US8 n=1 Tax=Human herpesvirus 2 TaxID=10310 RepID=Q69354_HHV2|nr:hypothetical protein [Human alphaherpesvirus 2]QBH82873.1 hypothetical protein [Human alphaherpesvirus 2]CAA28488.1 unnamed protein product [Human alphaherpesvirus 2]